jgi:hypothetical protein
VPDVPPSGLGRKPLVTITKPRVRSERPPPCRRCQGRSWWNGWRIVFPIVALVAGLFERWELPLARAKCSVCRRSFTVYPDGIYPRRQHQLDAVAEVVADAALAAGISVAATRAAHASPTSVRRWTAWVSDLAVPSELLAVAAQLDPAAPAGAGFAATASPVTLQGRAIRVLFALESLGAGLLRRGLVLAERTGLGRVLGWQHRVHGDVYGLVAGPRHLSPRMALGGAPGGT